MKKSAQWLCVAFVLAGLTACAEKAPPEENPSGVIPQAQLDALNKAKNVEHVLTEQAEKKREAAETQ